jgi:acyl-coenzyme A thioesterase PaaI-like protein
VKDNWLKNARELLEQKVPVTYRETARVWLFGALKVPMLFWLRPVVLELSDQRCVVKMALTRRSQNHLRSMYFGALAAGADCAGGLMAMARIQHSGQRIDLSFKDFYADFHKRAMGDTHFICEDAQGIEELVNKTIESGERENLEVNVYAICPDIDREEKVASFRLTLSLKRR